MHVENIRIAPAEPGRVRSQAVVRYDDRPGRPEVMWFEVPAALADSVDGVTGNAFFAALLPLATVLEQGLDVAAPVDELLLENAPAIRAMWAGWYGTRTDLPISAPARPRRAAGPARRVAFFSGGIDSTFTAWRGAGLLDGSPVTLDELLFIEGFDIGLRETARVDAALANARAAALDIGLPLHAVRTNLRDTRWREADWTLLSHGPCLAATALALGGRYGEALIASSVYGGRDVPWGSHPRTDALLSSSTLLIRDDGPQLDRMTKLRLLAHHPKAVRHLRVCWHSIAGGNCGRCRKCVLARVMLDMLAGEAACPGIPRVPDHLALLRALPVESGDERSDMTEVHREAQSRGRTDILAAAAHALSGDPTVRECVSLHIPRSMRPPWWKRVAATLSP